jgi:hypothetical protein
MRSPFTFGTPRLIRVFLSGLLLILGWELGTTESRGQAPYPLLTMTNSPWRYDFRGANLGSVWRATNYDDSAWSSGIGVFALETDNPIVLQQTNTIMPLSNASNARITTYYFRTHFLLTNSPYEVVLVFTNLVDDGMVVYVNGLELGRFVMPAAPAPITYITAASAAVEASYNTIIIPGDLLRKGDNLLAVEVHNASSTSSDIVFGGALTATFPTPGTIIITNDLVNQTVPEAAKVTFSVGATGLPRYYQWFKNGQAIPDADGPRYVIPAAYVPDGGTYWVTISNTVSFVESAHVNLAVLGDTNGPTMLSADRLSSNQIVLTFSEPVEASTATNVLNYTITNAMGGLLQISGVTLQDGTNVILTADPMTPGFNYVVVASGVQDVSTQSNLMAPNSMIPVGSTVELLNEFSFVYFYNPFVTSDPPSPGDDNPDLGSAWWQPDYLVNQSTNDFWGDNDLVRGAFFLGTAALPAESGTELSSSKAPVVYFRAPFFFADSPLGARFTLDYLMTDGGVIYAGGNELLRVNLPSSKVSWNTGATAASNATWRNGLNGSDMSMNLGWNTICAELHSFSVPQTNMAFALRLKARVTSFPTGPVIITSQPANQTVLEVTPVAFSFMAAGPQWFQWYENGVPILGATNPTYSIPAVPIEKDGAQFSVMAWNSTSSAMSSNAVLTVLKDVSPPLLQSAFAISSNQILVSFSKRLEPASATNPGNYSLTNGIGPSLAVQGATLTNGTNVILVVTSGSGTKPYVLVVNNVKDATSQGNVIQAGSAVTVGLNISIPIEAVWKYDISGSDLGTTWKDVAYNDGSWNAGAGLLYHEDASLPAPKSTELPLVNSVGSYIVTYYFRKHVPLPTGSTNTAITFRHVIDDGGLIYANGAEFHRFGMAAGAPAWTTMANVSVGDAVFTGPVTVNVTTLGSGENILAAEVHQYNSFSSDMCFGAEFSLKAPSIVIPVVTYPKVTMSVSKRPLRLNWPGTGYILQRASDLNGTNTVWQDQTGASSPYTLTPSNAAGFFRLRR